MTIKTADEFRAFAQEIVANTPDPDPAVAADKILGELSPDEWRVALGVTLTHWLRSYVSNIDRATRRREPRTVAVAPGSSARRRLIREDWEQKMATRLCVGDEYKFLRDCVSENLRAAAQIRYELAEATRFEGDRWSRIADHMDAHGYSTAADIPPAELRSFWAVQS